MTPLFDPRPDFNYGGDIYVIQPRGPVTTDKQTIITKNQTNPFCQNTESSIHNLNPLRSDRDCFFCHILNSLEPGKGNYLEFLKRIDIDSYTRGLTQFTTKSGTFEGLRSVYLLKNFSIALAWAFVTSPILMENSDSILLFLQRFLFLFALSVSIDLRDIKKDKMRRIVTFPIQHGFRKTKGGAIILLLLSTTLVYFYTCHQSSNSLLTASITSAILSIIGILNLHEQSTNKQYLLLVDGNLLLHGILFFIFA